MREHPGFRNLLKNKLPGGIIVFQGSSPSFIQLGENLAAKTSGSQDFREEDLRNYQFILAPFK